MLKSYREFNFGSYCLLQIPERQYVQYITTVLQIIIIIIIIIKNKMGNVRITSWRVRVMIFAVSHCQLYKNNEWCITMLLWRIYIASNKKTYLGLPVKCAFTFVKFWVSSMGFNSPVFNFTEIRSVGVVIYVDRRADMTRLVSLVLFATMRTRRQLF